MGWIKDETGRAVGLPAPSAEFRSTRSAPPDSGLQSASMSRATFIGLDLKGARVAVQGFGAVGKHAARFLAEKGADPGRGERHERHLGGSGGARRRCADRPQGCRTIRCATIRHGRKLEPTRSSTSTATSGFRPRGPMWCAPTMSLGCRTRLMPQGANIPCTPEAELALHKRGVLVSSRFHCQCRRRDLRRHRVSRRHPARGIRLYRRAYPRQHARYLRGKQAQQDASARRRRRASRASVCGWRWRHGVGADFACRRVVCTENLIR